MNPSRFFVVLLMVWPIYFGYPTDSKYAVAADIIVDSFTKAGLPTVGTPGRLARVTDDARGLWMDQGSVWFPLNGGVYNVHHFGAKCDNSTDDRTAIQAAIDAGGSGATIVIPGGTCKVSGNIALAANQHLTGMGWNQSTISMTSTTSGAVVVTGNTRTQISHLQIGTNANSQVAVELAGATETMFFRVWFSEPGTGKTGKGLFIHGTATAGSLIGQVIACNFEGFSQAIQLGRASDAVPGANGWSITHSRFSSNATAITGENAQTVNIAFNDIENNTSRGIYLPTGAGFNHTRWTILGNYFENNTTENLNLDDGAETVVAWNQFINGQPGTDAGEQTLCYGTCFNNAVDNLVYSTNASVRGAAGDANFTRATLTQGTITTNTPILDASTTWNNSGVPFQGIKYNVTNTASQGDSKVFDLQLGGTTKFSVGPYLSGFLVDMPNTTVRLGDPGAKPTCSPDWRGTIWHDFGAGGVKDSVEVCAKDASDLYSWRTLY